TCRVAPSSRRIVSGMPFVVVAPSSSSVAPPRTRVRPAVVPSGSSLLDLRVESSLTRKGPSQGGRAVAKKYVLKLTAEERAELEQLVKKGKAAGWKIQRAHTRLPCDHAPE